MLGEGAGMLVLEDEEHARARGAEVLTEVAGFGMSSDAHHITQPSAEGAARAIRRALNDAGVAADALDYVNAHGTGTLTNDPTEARALRLSLGDRARRVAVSSTKAMHGHALGAAGAIEAVATIVAMRGGWIPPTINFTECDPDCPLDVVANTVLERRIELALSNSFAFGGLNAVLLFRHL